MVWTRVHTHVLYCTHTSVSYLILILIFGPGMVGSACVTWLSCASLIVILSMKLSLCILYSPHCPFCIWIQYNTVVWLNFSVLWSGFPGRVLIDWPYIFLWCDQQRGGNLAMLAERFLHEVAFKLWKAPKYGAWGGYPALTDLASRINNRSTRWVVAL